MIKISNLFIGVFYMSRRVALLEEMVVLLDRLIETATELNEVAVHACTEEDLVPLQEQQKEILAHLRGLDDLVKKEAPQKDERQIKQRLIQKVNAFQKLNQDFLTHVESRFRVICQRGLHPEVLRDLQRSFSE